MPSNNQNRPDDRSIRSSATIPSRRETYRNQKHVKRKNSATQKLVLSAGDVSFGHY